MVLNIISIMWNLRVTLVYPKSLRKLGIHHSQPDLKKVDIVVIYAGGCHYSAVGKCTGRCHVFVGWNRGFRVSVRYARVSATYLTVTRIEMYDGLVL